MGCQRSSERRLGTATYTLEVPMDDVVGVEITEAIGYIA